MEKVIFVTGSAGFIGSNLVLKLLKENEDIHIIGIDNMNDYYDVSIKEYRLNKIKEEVKKTTNKWSFYYGNISDKKLIDKILKYRIFDDENGKMGWNVSQASGGILLVSQFTLMAQTQKGLRPDFGPAMPPSDAKALYEQLVEYTQQQFENVQTGIFAADMKVHLVNDGPVTFNLEIE